VNGRADNASSVGLKSHQGHTISDFIRLRFDVSAVARMLLEMRKSDAPTQAAPS
jgi:hypothetical protein